MQAATTDKGDAGSPRPGRRQMSLGVFLAGVALTALIAALLASTAAERDRLAFEASVRAAVDAVNDRVDTSIALLRGAAGLFASHERAITPDSFRAYVERLSLRERYPGILAIGFSRRVGPAERAELERQLRAQGQREFRLWPEGQRPEYYPIVYLEPLDARNRVAIGYDMFSEPVRRAAMTKARDTGTAAASGVVELVQEIDERKQPGFLIYVPVYRGGPVPETLEERRQQLLGFAYSPIRAHDFLSSAFSHETEPSVAFELYHGITPQAGSLLYAYGTEGAPPPSRARFTATRTVEVAGEPWTFVFRSRTPLAEAVTMPLLVALAGLALSFVLAVLVRRETAARGEAQHALEGERVARAEAERANLAKDEFLATLSHELRTPLGAIIGWTAVLRRGGLSESELRDAVEVVDRNAKAQARLIEDLLDMNRIISGKLRMELQVVDPAAVLADALASVAPGAQAKGVRIETDIDPAPMAVRADPARLQQVAWNLLSNAIKFTPRGGRVRVAVQRVDGVARLTVSDSGEGIEPGFIARIFDRFAQGDGSITRRHGGLGLGLAIVRQLVDLHGGTVRAESEGRGRGATFVVELPLLERGPATGLPIASGRSR